MLVIIVVKHLIWIQVYVLNVLMDSIMLWLNSLQVSILIHLNPLGLNLIIHYTSRILTNVKVVMQMPHVKLVIICNYIFN